MKDINDYQLTENITVGELKSWIVEKNDTSKNKIIELNKMNPSSEILFINEENIPESIQTKKCHSGN